MRYMNDSVVSDLDLRSTLNQLLLNRRMQTTIVTFIILVLGIFGNLVVLAAYWKLMKKRKIKEMKGRYFMPVLAVADLVSVFVGGVFFIYTDFHRAVFYSNVGCKLGMFTSFTTNTISILVLLLIAISRYIKICHPLYKLTLVRKRISLFIVVASSVGMCMPFCYFSGVVEKETSFARLRGIITIPREYMQYNTTFHMCFATKENNLVWKFYYYLLFLVQLLVIITMTVLHVRMGKVIYIRCKPSKGLSLPANDTVSTEKTLDDTESNNAVTGRDIRIEESTVQISNAPHYTDINESTNSSSGVNINSTTRCSRRRRKHKVWKKTRNRFTMMFLVIMVLYALTNIPTFIFLFLFMESNKFKIYFTLKSGFEEYNLILCLVRVHLINNIVNPFIYGYFDFAFRKEVKRMCYNAIIKPARTLCNVR